MDTTDTSHNFLSESTGISQCISTSASIPADIAAGPFQQLGVHIVYIESTLKSGKRTASTKGSRGG